MLSLKLSGILVIGGAVDYPSSPQSVEFWSAADPEQGSCVLNDFLMEVYHPTVNLVSGCLVACYSFLCEIYREGRWHALATSWRARHSSATTKDAVLLIGGTDEGHNVLDTTEWIPLDGSPAHQGPFTVRHEKYHCTIQISDNTIVVTGGIGTRDYVTQYQLAEGKETPLASMQQPRYGHACAIYQDTTAQQVKQRL